MDLIKSQEIGEGTLVSSLKQTNGRGQMNTVWKSEEGKNLTISIIYKPKFLEVKNIFALSMAVSLGLYDVLSDLLDQKHDIKIKWPNDIMVNKKKICGILIENTFRQSKIDYSIIGIGLNVNQEFFDEGVGQATSLKKCIGKETPLKDVLELLCLKIEKRYLQLRNGNLQEIKNTYLSRLYLFNTVAMFSSPDNQKINGTITDVGTDGVLKFKHTSSEVCFFRNKELIFLQEN